jgi:UDP-N-acetyl-D-mannosaminuronic acid dehydrogenase
MTVARFAEFRRERLPIRAKTKTISVLGLGYVGLPVSVAFASRGFDVVGVDVQPTIVNKINNGHIHVAEPDLSMLVQAAVSAGKLRAAVEPEPADVFIIAVPTPMKENYEPELGYIERAVDMIAPLVKKGDLIVLESTSPVGTTERICAAIGEKRPDLVLPDPAKPEADIHIAHCPERVLPGSVLRELVDNDRIVGGISPACAAAAAQLYRAFVKGDMHLTNARTAELAKLAENAFRDVNIAFANELSIICERFGINVWELIELANRHPRVNILKPGPGVGGHCIAVDPWFIVHAAQGDAKVIRAAREVNDSKPHTVLSKIRAAAAKLDRPVIACLGLSYKADIDDLRESPALHIVEMLARETAGELLDVEPNISELPPSLARSGAVALTDLRTALSKAKIVVLLVDHKPFRQVDRKMLAQKIVVDTRGIWR